MSHVSPAEKPTQNTTKVAHTDSERTKQNIQLHLQLQVVKFH